MLFNSPIFIFIFLPLTLALHNIVCKNFGQKFAIVFLAVASLIFYAYWDPNNLCILIPSIAFNYVMGRLLLLRKSKLLLALGIATDLLVLGYYKYIAFFSEVLNSIGLFSIPQQDITLPLGISFFTFTQIGYLVDTYRRETSHCTLPQYGLFVTIFPHLIAGPILDYKQIIPQFRDKMTFVFSHTNFSIGIVWFSIGLFKKVIIADSLAPLVSNLFAQAHALSFIEAWIAALGYTLQLFFDFSAYSEMAIGLGLLFNIRLPLNFNSPYHACSVGDFWRRWHISLSTFLKNYLYIPLGGNRCSSMRCSINLMITMLLGGLWHGAGWQFIIWGGMHGTFLVINRLWKQSNIRLPKTTAWFLTMLSIVTAWVFFRAATISDAWAILSSMGDVTNISKPTLFKLKFSMFFNWVTPFVILGLLGSTQQYVKLFRPNLFWAVIVLALLFISITNMYNVSEFLYFQF